MLAGVWALLQINLVNKDKKSKDLNKKASPNAEIKVRAHAQIQKKNKKNNKSELGRDSKKNFVDKSNLNRSLFKGEIPLKPA